MEQRITKEQARDILTGDGYDAYGLVRLYGVIAEGECKGQSVAIKSTYYLDREEYSEITVISRDTLNIQIRKL